MLLTGCGSDSTGNWPAADISGEWTGAYTESGSETSITFLFIQSGPTLTGTASFMGSIKGAFHGRTLTIDGSDLVGYLADDFATIRGSFTTAAGKPAVFTITKDAGAAIPLSAPSSSSGNDGQSSDGDGSDSGDDWFWPSPGNRPGPPVPG